MKLIRSTTNKDGSVNVTIRLAPGEKAFLGDCFAYPVPAHVEPMTVNTRHHYRLGGQVGDIVAPNVLTEAAPVAWCSVTQEWLEV